MAHVERLCIDVVYCPQPGHTDATAVQLPAGATVADALSASGLLQRYGLDPGAVQVGIWSRLQTLQTTLRDRDRVEVYRPLQVDPKEARRQRYKRHRQAVSR
ncbi:MAG: RnfH family protein [Rubrivivax sp.]|nr:RnfH family protein [Rubrivivax sp.]